MIFTNAKKAVTSEIANDLARIKAVPPNCTISLVYTSMSDTYSKKKKKAVSLKNILKEE